MDINTHKKIDRNLCGKPLEIDEGFSRVELLLTDNMAADESGLVHGGFVFGLASVCGIIKNHGGFINVYSEKGKGSTFNIYLPACENIKDDKKKETDRRISGTGTILFVDDEKMIIDVGQAILKKLGYNVITATGGQEAVDLFEKNRDKIDLVVLDMIMPDMNGREVFDKIREINPDVKVMLSSGYALDGQAAGIMEKGCNGFIQKPFNVNKLSVKINEILHGQ